MKKGKRQGYTLIELMIVILIIGILSTIILPHMVKGRYQAQFTSCQFNVRALASALENYHTDKNTYPRDETEWKSIFQSTDGNPPYISPEPRCPSNNSYYSYTPDPDGEYTGKDAIHDYLLQCNGIHHLIIKAVKQGFPQYRPAIGLMATQTVGEESSP